MLLSNYQEIIGSDITQVPKRLVCFKFTKDDGFYEFLRSFKKKFSLDAIVLNKTIPPYGIKVVSLPTIRKWLKSLASAEYIFTDSYHGLIFALVFKKKVIVKPANIKNFGRLKDLMQVLQLENRIYYNYNDVLNDDNWKNEIDYDGVYKILNPMIEDSKNYLNTEINICEKTLDR